MVELHIIHSGIWQQWRITSVCPRFETSSVSPSCTRVLMIHQNDVDDGDDDDDDDDGGDVDRLQ